MDKKAGMYAAGLATGVLLTLGVTAGLQLGSWLSGSGLSGLSSSGLQDKGAQALTDRRTAEKLNEVERLIEKHYLNEADGALLTDLMFKGVAVGLDDPYAEYYTAEELQSVLDSSKGAYFGIGVTLSEDRTTGVIHVAQVYEDSPADRAGMQVGDLVKAVNGEPAETMDLTELVSRIKGAEGTFAITVYRPSDDREIELTMECEEVKMHQIEYRMLEEKIGYIELLEFTENAALQFEDALLDLKGQGMQQLIVDVRGNPGGLLDAVCDISDLFLDEERIVYMEDKAGHREEYYAKSGKVTDCEVAVLTDGYSASASEIFAGVIQDYKLGPVVGAQTYGKGTVQVTYPLRDGSAFKMTVQEYYTANGQKINGTGITPDIIIEETESGETENESSDTEDPVLQAAIDALLD